MKTLATVIFAVVPPVIAMGAGWWFLVRLENRRLGGRGQFALYRRALKSAEIPAGADTTAWLSQLRREERPEANRGWKSWIAPVVVLALIVGVNIASAFDGAVSRQGRALAVLVPLAVASAFVGLVTTTVRIGIRRRRALRATLELCQR
jgi:lipopolysaccharide export LptBFGC system permease protein LptF